MKSKPCSPTLILLSQDDQLFPNAVLAETTGPGTAHSADGPVLPPSAGYINWVNEAEDMKQRASFAVNGGGQDLVMPAWGDEQSAAPAATIDGGLDSFAPDWWCQEHQRQHSLYLQEQAGLVPWDAFGQTDVSSCLPWPACDVDRAGGMLAVTSAAAQPLILHDAAYPPLLDDMEMGLDPYPEMKVAPFATPTKHWPDSSPSYVFPHVVENATPFILSEASSPSSDASLSNVSEESDLEARFASTLSLSATAPSSDRVLRSASSSPGVSSPGLKGKTTAKARAPTTKARASRSRKRLPSIPPELPPVVERVASRARRIVRLSCKKEEVKRSRSSSASSSSEQGARALEGPPYDKIDDMDPVSKRFLETMLLSDRDALRFRKVPYSIIQAKLRHLYSGAEETLRGHHRRLVLPKEQRVRKPVWLPRDVS